ncbi:MAG TPA: hypothetical protein VMF13_21315 [Luteitalea sp.]|nr:hypothetical protein [Luteitalea sp.]
MASRRWIPIALGCLLIVVIGAGAIVGSCAYLVRKQVQVQERSSEGDYEREAAKILERFDGVPVLVEDGSMGPSISRRALGARRERVGSGRPLSDLHVLVYARKERKLVRLKVPFWLLRMAPDGRMKINVDNVDLDNVRLSIDDLESAGPGPLFLRKDDESRVLVWTE